MQQRNKGNSARGRQSSHPHTAPLAYWTDEARKRMVARIGMAASLGGMLILVLLAVVYQIYFSGR